MQIKSISSCTPDEILHIQSEYQRLSFCIECILSNIVRLRKPEIREIQFDKFTISKGEVMVSYSYRLNVYGPFMLDTMYFPVNYLHMADAEIKDEELRTLQSDKYLKRRFDDIKKEYDHLKKIFT